MIVSLQTSLLSIGTLAELTDLSTPTVRFALELPSLIIQHMLTGGVGREEYQGPKVLFDHLCVSGIHNRRFRHFFESVNKMETQIESGQRSDTIKVTVSFFASSVTETPIYRITIWGDEGHWKIRPWYMSNWGDL